MKLNTPPVIVGALCVIAVQPVALRSDAAKIDIGPRPVVSVMSLTGKQLRLAQEGKLALQQTRSKTVVPAQWESGTPSQQGRIVYFAPPIDNNPRKLRWLATSTNILFSMQATRNPDNGQIEIHDSGNPVLRYNYSAVEPGEILAKISEANRIYARARSDYIHPLYGMNGELLTRDWPVDHPHHRGIYWAWPEVDFGKERGDLHALQKVFARPTGRFKLQGGPVYAQVEAENQWLWDDREPIVLERVIVRAYRSAGGVRFVDLAFKFLALKEGVALARRGTDAYGGLNLRMETPQAQSISVYTSPTETLPRRAWSDLSGVFAGSGMRSGLTVLQHRNNPDYPGDWIQYPDLSWCQPAFPAAGKRYPLSPGRPLVLRYRLCLHSDAAPGLDWFAGSWDSLHAQDGALPLFTE